MIIEPHPSHAMGDWAPHPAIGERRSCTVCGAQQRLAGSVEETDAQLASTCPGPGGKRRVRRPQVPIVEYDR